MLEELLEEEKREQARHTGATQMDQGMPNPNQQSLLNDQVRKNFEVPRSSANLDFQF